MRQHVFLYTKTLLSKLSFASWVRGDFDAGDFSADVLYVTRLPGDLVMNGKAICHGKKDPICWTCLQSRLLRHFPYVSATIQCGLAL